MKRKRTTQRLASMVARRVVSQSTMKFASDSPQFSYVELTLSMKFASCDDDPGVVAPEFTIRPIFSMNPR
ncbi:hypothetical protein MAL08_08625 [Leptospira noguchii]|uniref:hypothetical protein n=1 Tax=Leptospira noguchii TaxID=28182 RepID=UPI001FB6A289|nr:hypothetical protein [Leptospira noguchii]UOG39306.1 hypothetical protein MAL08_08625 [Leptospira noguchii]